MVLRQDRAASRPHSCRNGAAMSVLVTGGAGYIGSHMVYALLDAGERVVVLDNLSTGLRELVSPDAIFVEGDVADRQLVEELLTAWAISEVFHFAGSVVVPESIENPLLYYRNNTSASRALIETSVERGVQRFIFSSTAAIYGQPSAAASDPIGEDAEKRPVNPYGRSKLMTEWMLDDVANASDLRYAALRYFNVAGADPGGRTGQSTPRATHLIKRASQAALGKVPYLGIFGTDYPTPDGTGIRDYIHVSDIVNVHALALAHLRDGGASITLNCGYGHGFSVREVVASVERVSRRPVPVRELPRREGDPPSVVSDPRRLKEQLRWSPRYDDLDQIVRNALVWESRLG